MHVLPSGDGTVYRNIHAHEEVNIKNFSKALIAGGSWKGSSVHQRSMA